MNVPKPGERARLRKWQARGQGLVEYALIMVLVVIVVVAILTVIGLIVRDDMYSKISSGFPNP